MLIKKCSQNHIGETATFKVNKKAQAHHCEFIFVQQSIFVHIT